ncbi:MAG TPA: DNA polymerase Y family protein [Burkholderiaceae bacterium]|nr:DNA polymerase Y family protein [Burkholderiaceae bacterium]
MLWFALHLPTLPLEAWRSAAADRADARPGCVVDARCVVQADALALAAGIEPGMSAATAASLAAGLQVFARDPLREAALVERLALALARFTPSIVLQRDGVLLEVAASLRLFGGARALWRAVRDAAQAGGVQTLRMAAAPTATAASVLARAEPRSPALQRLPTAQRLDALPLADALAAWGIDERQRALLHGIGCRTLGDVRMLPRTGAQRRGMAPLLDVIARAHGDAPDPQPWFELPRRFEQGLELLQRADDAAMLVFAAQRLVQPLAGWLAQQWLAATQLTLVLRHETSVRHALPDTALTLALADPTRDAAQVLLLLRERLQRTALPAPVYALVLRLDHAVRHAGRDTTLWRERGGAGEDARALFDRLAARLGAERVCRPALVADHRPERAMAWQPVRDAAPASDVAPVNAARPAWLLPAPQALAEDRASGQPLYRGAPLALRGRPERIEAGWFDGALVSRDYLVAEARDRRCLWVFRERRGDDVPRWYLHGVFG